MKRLFTWLAGCVSLMLMMAACAPVPTAYTQEQALDQALDQVTESLVSQLKKQSILLNIPGKLSRSGMVMDPVLDSESGQQTSLTKRVESFVSERITSKHPEFEVLPFLVFIAINDVVAFGYCVLCLHGVFSFLLNLFQGQVVHRCRAPVRNRYNPDPLRGPRIFGRNR